MGTGQLDNWGKHKHNARRLFRNSRRRGESIAPDRCEGCGTGSVALEGHHCNYSKPLEVDWFCKPCHDRWHSTWKFVVVIIPEAFPLERMCSHMDYQKQHVDHFHTDSCDDKHYILVVPR